MDNKVPTALPEVVDVEESSAEPGSYLYLLCLWEIFSVFWLREIFILNYF